MPSANSSIRSSGNPNLKLNPKLVQQVRLANLKKQQAMLIKPAEEEEGPKNFKQKFGATAKTIYKKLGLKHFGFVVVLVAYSFLGALIFHLIEGPPEQERKLELVKNLNDSARNLTSQILSVNKNPEEILDLIKQYQMDSGLMPSERLLNRTNWDFWGSMFYAGTLYTTIGYGHYAPATTGGRWATIIYAIIGIPLVLATLADLGRLLTKMLKRMWTFVVWAFRSCVNLCQRKKRIAEDLESIKSQEAEEFDLPIPIAVGLFIGWLGGCAFIFGTWEKTWSYFTALYFFFVSLSTIGLGDVTPDHPKYLLLCFPLVIMGLSLVSMVINLIQNKMEAMKDITTEFLEEELGLDTESSSDENEYNQYPEKNQYPDDEEKDNPISLGIIQTWTKKVARRKRRGVQTDESFLREIRRKYPHTPYSELENSGRLSRSRDDVNSLIDALEFY